MICNFSSFHQHFSDIASFCRKRNALVLTSDSDFLLFDLKGVILFDRIAALNSPIVYRQEKILNHFKMNKEQIYYFVSLRGNDFVSPTVTIQNSEKKRLGAKEAIKYVKDHFTHEVKSYKKYNIVKAYYNIHQVNYPWNTITTDVLKESIAKKNITLGCITV